MKMVPNGISYDTGSDPAVLHCECFDRRKQPENLRLSPEEPSYVVAALHVSNLTPAGLRIMYVPGIV